MSPAYHLSELQNSLVYAQTIQNGLLPKARHFKKCFQNSFVYYKPQQNVGGDFYWLSQKNQMIYFAMADCTGHGIGGAMLSVLGISLLNYVIQKRFDNLGDYLKELDKKWIETFNNEHHDEYFNNDWLEITLVSYNTITKEFHYSSASGEFSIYQNGKMNHYKGNKYPIGGWQIEKERVFDSYQIHLEENAQLFFFSDGIKHQFDDSNKKKFGKKKLFQFLGNHINKPFEEQKNLFNKEFNQWMGSTIQTDDVSLVSFQF